MNLRAESAGWYYYGPRAANSGLPKRASLKSFIRSTTLSLGSIAFGSLIVTILELLRLILQSVQQYEAGQGDSTCAHSGSGVQPKSSSDSQELTNRNRSDWTDRRLLRELPLDWIRSQIAAVVRARPDDVSQAVCCVGFIEGMIRWFNKCE